MDHPFYNANKPEDDYQIRIDRDGQWYHQDAIMARTRLAKLFSTALYYDDNRDDYWLITPHEQGRIEVADVPFIVTDFKWDEDTLVLITNFNESIHPDHHNPIFCRDNTLPYIKNDKGIMARINRTVREKLINIAIDQNGYNDDDKTLTLKANGHDHIIART